MITPLVWSDPQLEVERRRAIDIFRRERLEEPLEAYLQRFEIYQSRIEDLLEHSVDLTRLHAIAPEVLTRTDQLETIRYLPGPPISADDLKVLTDAVSLAPQRLKADPELVARIVEIVLLGLDRRRFPWVSENRSPTMRSGVPRSSRPRP